MKLLPALIAMAAAASATIDRPEYSIGTIPVALSQDSPLDRFTSVLSAIGNHAHPPLHCSRWTEKEILVRLKGAFAIFYSHIAVIASTLELHQWRAALIELMQQIDHYCDITLQVGIQHLDCITMLEIADRTQAAFTAYCQQAAKWHSKIIQCDMQMGWLVHNRFVRVLTPDGYSAHCGFANLAFLALVSIANRCIDQMTDIADGVIPTFSFDMGFIVLDKTFSNYEALRSILSKLTQVSLFRARTYAAVDGIVDWYVALALPGSVIDQLIAGQLTTIPTTLGQLNPQFTIEASLRKLAHWHRQSRFSLDQLSEVVKVLLFRPTKDMMSTALKCDTGIGGFRHYHNCSFIGHSWCMTIDSQKIEGTYKYQLPDLCRNHCIVLELPTLTVNKACALMHNHAYANWAPTEALHRHCCFPLSSMQIEGVRSLSLLTDDCEEIPADDIVDDCELPSGSTAIQNESSSLTQQEYSVMIAAAAAIAKKRKNAH